MLTSQGDVKLIDFSYCSEIGEKNNKFLGPTGYCAPEVFD